MLGEDALYWWKQGKDTWEIARILNRGALKPRSIRTITHHNGATQQSFTEAQVYNALSDIREARRRGDYAAEKLRLCQEG